MYTVLGWAGHHCASPVCNFLRSQWWEAGQAILLMVVDEVLWDLFHARKGSCEQHHEKSADEFTPCVNQSIPDVPLSAMRTFFHCVFPTLGVWQNKMLCLSQTKMRSRTNLLMWTWVKFLRLLFLHTVRSSCSRISTMESHSDMVVAAEDWALC